MMWVVFGHVFSYLLGGSINSDIEATFLTPFFLLVEAGLFAVDIFFFVGGFLISYVVLRDA